MSLEIAIAENTAALRELIAQLAKGLPTSAAQITAVVKEAEDTSEADAAAAAAAKKAKDAKEAKAKKAQEAADAAADVTLDPKDDGAGAVDLDAVIAVTLALGKAGKRPQLVELLEAYGVAKSSLLHKNDYAGFHAKATELLGE
ncbi:hypothetical protein UFOVP555_46 [uncultured Caudovirales phage]|uniref:Uncharacterized protein n=1 Tax=uncultured Caudovirales phage TaxID=2100421 RepID=A0A6J5MY35_9CAUD|nr:hypothetical protein UFOVP555_46 [uncultured Caudovirales phage]